MFRGDLSPTPPRDVPHCIEVPNFPPFGHLGADASGFDDVQGDFHFFPAGKKLTLSGEISYSDRFPL